MNSIEELVISAQSGDRKAFERLYELTFADVYYTCLSFLRNEHDAKDLTQDTYVAALKNLMTLRNPQSFEPWIGRIAANLCRNYLKKNKPLFIEDEEFDGETEEQAEIFLPEQFIMSREKGEILSAMMKECLSDVQYRTAVMFYFNGMSIKEIAEIMECPEGTVSYRLNAVRKRVKQAVLDYEQKTGDRLHAVVGIPFLTSLFRFEASLKAPIPFDKSVFFKAKGFRSNSALSKIKNGGNMMKRIFEVHKTAAVAASIAVVLAAAGIITACSQGGAKNNKQPTEQSIVSEVVSSEEEQSLPESEPETAATAESGISDADVSDPMEHMGSEVRAKVDELMTALSQGDLETMYNITNSEFIGEMKESEEFGKILAAVYGDTVWNTVGITDSSVYSEYKSAVSRDNSSIDIYVDVGTKRYGYYEYYDLLRYKKDDVIPDGFKYETKEDAWKAFNETLDSMSLIYQRWQLKMSVPDEEGNFTLKLYSTDFNAFVDDSYTITGAKSDDTLLIDLLAEVCRDDVVIAPDGVEIAYNKEANGGEGLREKAVELMKKKDFEGARKLILEHSDEDFFTYSSYTYDTLTDAQKAYVDEVIDDIDMRVIETSGTSKTEMSVILLMEAKVLRYNITNNTDELMDWIEDNGIRDLSMIYATKEFFLDGFVDDSFGYYRELVTDAAYITE